MLFHSKPKLGQLSGLRTEPLNPREDKNKYSR